MRTTGKGLSGKGLLSGVSFKGSLPGPPTGANGLVVAGRIRKVTTDRVPSRSFAFRMGQKRRIVRRIGLPRGNR